MKTLRIAGLQFAADFSRLSPPDVEPDVLWTSPRPGRFYLGICTGAYLLTLMFARP